MKTLRESLSSFSLAAVAAISLSMTVAAKDPNEVTIKVEKSDQHQTKVELVVDGQTEKFVMPELALGETQTITSESGNSIDVTKNEKGMLLNINGKEVRLPSFHGNLGAKLHRSMPLHHMVSKGVQISGVELDDNQKQIIKDAFVAAGINEEVNFNSQTMRVIRLHGDEEHGDIEIERSIINGETHGENSQDIDVDYQVIVKHDEDESNQNKIKKHIIIKK